MRTRVSTCESKRLLKVVAAALLASASAACSGDSGRFSDSPFTNPFSSAPTAKVDRMATGSLPSRTAPIGTVTSQPLPAALPQGATSNPLNPGQIASAPSIASQQLPRVASSTLQQASPIGGSAAGWSAAGGTPVTVGAGETANTLSARYGVPVAAITAANGGQVRSGQQAIIPVFGGNNGAAKTGLMEPARTTTSSIKPLAAKPATDEDDDDVKKVIPPAKIAQSNAPTSANPLPPASVPSKNMPNTSMPTADGRALAARPTIVAAKPLAAGKPIPAVKGVKPAASDDEDETPKKIMAAAPAKSFAVISPTKAPAKGVAAKPLKPVVDDEDEDETPVKKAEKPAAPATRPTPRIIPLTPQASKPVEAPAKVAEIDKVDPVTTQAIAPAAKSEDKPEFRWPAKGRVISGFGSKGGNGDGIAIAVPEGTSVKAAEGGTVAYAGEELKGYGKLVLVRHDNGFVSAYAHNGELNVKRGEKVSRGQTIAKSGSTGNVTSPQLHFELRKGSTPVDPTKYLEN